ncbi:MAG: ADP-ribosylglycohydrolase family protein [Kofleriaceae bacterium]
MKNDHARGALLGLAVGDALGTTYEFKQLAHPPYPMLARGPATDVVGGGPFELPPGAVTDDTQLAVCLARSLVERGGIDPDDLAARYVAWSRGAFDIGSQTLGAVDRIVAGDRPAQAGLAVWRARDHRPAGNGSLMRTAPIGVAFAARPDALIDAAIAESLLNHAHPRCVLACVAFDAAIGAAIVAPTGEPLDGAGMVAVARAALPRGLERIAWCEPTEVALVASAARDLATDLDAALADDPAVYAPGLHIHDTMGFVRVAFRLAFWHAVHTPSWRDAVVDVASRGGDADTNGAIVGALVGARDGAGAIPPAWVERVLGATQGGGPAWGEAHHPRHLLALIAPAAEE